jgi:hypothetical protein
MSHGVVLAVQKFANNSRRLDQPQHLQNVSLEVLSKQPFCAVGKLNGSLLFVPLV